MNMSWLYLSLIAPAIFAVVAFIDTYVITQRIKDSRCMTIYSGIAAAIVGTIVWLCIAQPNPGLRNGLLIIVSGMISLFGYALYYYALSQSQTSYVIALLQTNPLFTLILSIIVLHARLTFIELIGFFLIFIAVLGLSLDMDEKKIILGRPFYAVLLANVLFAISDVIIKFTIGVNGFVPIFVYESWGVAIAAILLIVGSKSIRHAFTTNMKVVKKSTLLVVFLNEGLFIVSRAITFLAISLGPVALVVVLGGTQVLYGLVIGLALTWFFPKIFHEETSKKVVLYKLLFSLMLFTGVGLLAKL